MTSAADIGVLTLYDRINYGALLQTYALQEYLSGEGYSVEVVDYRPEPPNGGKSIKQIIRSAVWSRTLKPLLRDRNRLRVSDEFRSSYIRLSRETFNDSSELTNHCRYQTMIVGSDQVWNPNLIGEDDSWFLDFPHCNHRISYAASFGLPQLPDCYTDAYRQGIGKMQSVSVREETGAAIVENLIGERPSVVMDPVFLLKADKWREVMLPASMRGYVLCYYMPGNPRVEAKIKSVAESYAKERGLRVFNIGKRDTSRLNPFDPSLYGIGPREFVGLVDGAEFVVTNSFHGTAFSLLLGKSFYSIVDADDGPQSLSSRMTDLLKRVGAYENILTTSSDVTTSPKPVDKSALEKEISLSKAYLASVLGRSSS